MLGLIGVAALLGIASPFLLRDVLDEAIPQGDTTLLSWLVAGMIGIAIATGVIGVYQTWLSNQVGQAVMHDLRARVYRHLQRMSLAFFTRTRTGEVQSRIANDIGGVQTVVTSTATSIVSNVTTVLATIVAMFLLDWRLAVFALVLLPIFVLLTRRVGEQRKLITTTRQRTMADMSTLVEESLSVSGILLGKTMGRSGALADRFEEESGRLAELEVRQRMAGRWVMSVIQMTFAIMPAAVYWFAGWSISNGGEAISIGTLVAFTTLQTRLFFPIGQLLSVGIDIQTSLALFDRVFEYLDLPVEIDEHDKARTLPRDEVRGDVALHDVWFRYDREGPWTLRDVSFSVPAGTRTALVGETGSGKTTLGYLVARLYDAERGSVAIDGVDVRDLTFASLSDLVGVVAQETYLFHSSVRDNLRFARPDATDEEVEAAARAARIHDTIVVARGRLRHGRRRARLPLQRRREAAHRDRPDDPAQPADPAARRGDELAGRRDGARRAGGARRARGGPHHDHDRAPPVDRSARPTRSSCWTTARSSSAAPTMSSCCSAVATLPSWHATRAPSGPVSDGGHGGSRPAARSA